MTRNERQAHSDLSRYASRAAADKRFANPRPGAHYNPRQKARVTSDDIMNVIGYIASIVALCTWTYFIIELAKASVGK